MIWVAVDLYDGKGQTINGRLVGQSKVPVGRPTYTNGWCLNDETHHWFASRALDYTIGWSTIKPGYWYVGITDPKMAMLFKLSLTWL